MRQALSRRGFLHVSAATVAAGLAPAACGDSDGASGGTDGGTAGESGDAPGSSSGLGSASASASGSASSTDGTDGSATAGSDGSSGSGAVCGVSWDTIQDQVWIVGAPVELDLAPFLIGVDPSAVAVAIEGTLPAGVTLEGTVISGTPLAEFESELQATADVEDC